MVVAIIGESCVGKSTIADAVKAKLNATIYSGKDYLRLAKNENDAKLAFKKLLNDSAENIIYVITEKEQLSFLPDTSKRIVVTADIETIKERFSKRTGGHLPAPLATMLEKKHGMFDNEKCDLHIENDKLSIDEAANKVLEIL